MKIDRPWLLVFTFVLAFVGHAYSGEQPTTRPIPAVTHVLIISIDGLRPDLLSRGQLPNIRGLLDKSCYTMWARTVKEAYTLPAHVSMLTGVVADRHGVTWNRYIEDSYSREPTIFELAKKQGLTTAMVSAKMKFIALARPGSLDWKYLADEDKADAQTIDRQVADQAIAILHEHQPNVLFVHLAEVDVTGHLDGWGSHAQSAAVGHIDGIVGSILAAVKSDHLADSTVIIFTADHGGAGRNHEPNDPRSTNIPWAVSGPGIKQNYDLTRDARLNVDIEDTFATACYLLAIHLPEHLDGKPVTDILDRGELLQPTAK